PILAADQTPENLLRDPTFQTGDVWSAKHTPKFKAVGPVANAPGTYGLGILENARAGEQSTISQTLALTKGKRYLLTFNYQTGAAKPPPADYQDLFVSVNDTVVWKADVTVSGFPPRSARLLFEAPADRVTLTFGKRALKDCSGGWLFPSTVLDIVLCPA